MKTRPLLLQVPVWLAVMYAASTPVDKDSILSSPDPEIVRDLQEIVELREQIAVKHQILVRPGRAAFA